ncbi:MAG: GTPase HflX [Rickettsiales bacterium]|nr:GTPase HflX [Rickettsiales bacterium]
MSIKSILTLVLHPELRQRKQPEHALRSAAEQLQEAVGLAAAIWLDVVTADIVPLSAIRPATYLGKGKVEAYYDSIHEQDIALVVFNGHLTPVQQRNLEKAWKCKVIDRTALILEIFGDRARTSEGKLQVELAALEYQKSRLVRSWTHLERQRGGFGFLGGPGETQIEADRRQLRDRIAAIRKQLEKVRRTRGLHRKARKDVPYPVVALVGYTNAGKSTLFNRLTGASVMAKDMLFATLDPTMRLLTLPSKRKVILSDTVGFISNLPTELIAAFRATLEEVQEADLILHVRDISAPDTTEQKADVLDVLEDILGDGQPEKPILEIWNKTDLLPTAPQPESNDILALSALTGEGCPTLLRAIDRMLSADLVPFSITLPASDGKTLAWIHQHGEGVEVTHQDDAMQITGMLPKQYAPQLQHTANHAIPTP